MNTGANEDSSSSSGCDPPPSEKSYLRPSKLLPPSTDSTQLLRPSKLHPEPSSPKKLTPQSTSTNITFVPLTKDVANDENEEDDKVKEPTKGPSFTFGENLSDRVSSTERKRKLEDEGVSETKDRKEVKVGEADAEVKTGEEGEVNVAQVNCRLYSFEDGNWVERVSRGILRLNDTETCPRLIIRTQGSLRVMLNTTVYKRMVLERPNDKSVKFTAVNYGEESVRVWLVMGTPADMDLFFNSLKQRINVE